MMENNRNHKIMGIRCCIWSKICYLDENQLKSLKFLYTGHHLAFHKISKMVKCASIPNSRKICLNIFGKIMKRNCRGGAENVFTSSWIDLNSGQLIESPEVKGLYKCFTICYPSPIVLRSYSVEARVSIEISP